MSKTIINPWNGQPMEIPEGGETTPAAVLAAAQGMTVPQKDATKAALAVLPQNESVRLATLLHSGANGGIVFKPVGEMANNRPFVISPSDVGDASYPTEPDGFQCVLPCNVDLSIYSADFLFTTDEFKTNIPLPSVGCLDYRITLVGEGNNGTPSTADFILAAFVALLPTYGAEKPYIDLTGLSAPSAQGVADADTLTAAGCTVLVTPPVAPEGFVEIPADGSMLAVVSLTNGYLPYGGYIARGTQDGETGVYSPSASGTMLLYSTDGLAWEIFGNDTAYPPNAEWSNVGGYYETVRDGRVYMQGVAGTSVPVDYGFEEEEDVSTTRLDSIPGTPSVPTSFDDETNLLSTMQWEQDETTAWVETGVMEFLIPEWPGVMEVGNNGVSPVPFTRYNGSLYANRN